jgi:hypothetical protein
MTKKSHGWMMIIIAFLVIVIISTGWVSAAGSPSIAISKIDDSKVYGTVANVDPSQYAVVVYVENGGKWWGPKPMWDAPLTTINPDLTWDCKFFTNANDAAVTTIRAYLISVDEKPQNATGQPEVPTSGWKFKAKTEKERTPSS